MVLPASSQSLFWQYFDQYTLFRMTGELRKTNHLWLILPILVKINLLLRQRLLRTFSKYRWNNGHKLLFFFNIPLYDEIKYLLLFQLNLPIQITITEFLYDSYNQIQSSGHGLEYNRWTIRSFSVRFSVSNRENREQNLSFCQLFATCFTRTFLPIWY